MFTSISFITSVFKPSGYPKLRLPEFVLCGRSNVGKSSFLNTISARKGIAQVSSTPGKTRSLNYFLVDEKFYLVDLPGFGYAKVQKSEIDRWEKMLIDYFAKSEHIKTVFHLIDSRHGPTKLDQQMKQMLDFYGHSSQVILTKVDKIKRSERAVCLSLLAKAGYSDAGYSEPIFFSAVSGEGKAEVRKKIFSSLNS